MVRTQKWLFLPLLMALMLATTSCETFRRMRPDDGPVPLNASKSVAIEDPDIKRYAGGIDILIDRYYVAKQAAYCATDSANGCPVFLPKALRTYQTFGITLADRYCDVFMRQMDGASGRLGYTRSLWNDTGTLVSAILSTASGDPGFIGLIGTATGVGDNAIRGYKETFLPPSELGKVFQQVRLARQEMLKTFAEGVPMDVPQVEQRLRDYEWACTPAGIRQMLVESIETGKPTYDEKTGLHIDSGFSNSKKPTQAK